MTKFVCFCTSILMNTGGTQVLSQCTINFWWVDKIKVGDPLFMVVLQHPGEGDVWKRHSIKFREFRFSKSLGYLKSAISPKVEENNGITILYRSDWFLLFVYDHKRRQILIIEVRIDPSCRFDRC